jgi:hypothetical protein
MSQLGFLDRSREVGDLVLRISVCGFLYRRMSTWRGSARTDSDINERGRELEEILCNFSL